MLRKLIPLTLLASVCLTAQAAEPEDLIKYRKSTMKAIGGHMGAIGAIVFGKAGSPDHLVGHANGLEAAALTTKDLFAPESAEGETDALPAIWENQDGFQQAIAKFEEAAQAFLDVAEDGDMAQAGPAFKTLGGTCKGCHDDYRKKKE